MGEEDDRDKYLDDLALWHNKYKNVDRVQVICEMVNYDCPYIATHDDD